MGIEKKDELHVHLGKNKSYRRQIVVSSNNKFFNNKNLIYIISPDKLTFKVTGIDNRKKTVSPNKSKYSSFTLTISSDYDIKFGDYLIDEDSMNEDEITIYLNDL